jgi:hypothetical protein
MKNASDMPSPTPFNPLDKKNLGEKVAEVLLAADQGGCIEVFERLGGGSMKNKIGTAPPPTITDSVFLQRGFACPMRSR